MSTNCKMWNEISRTIERMMDCGIKIQSLSHPDYEDCFFVKGNFENLTIIKKQMEIHFPPCETVFVSQTYTPLFEIWWDGFDKNEGVIKIKIPEMSDKEIIEKCFNK